MESAIMKEAHAISPVESKSKLKPSSPHRKHGWVNPLSSLAVTAGIGTIALVFYLIDKPTHGSSHFLGLFGLLVVLPAACVQLFITPFQAIATVADFVTKRRRRACLSLLATIVGVSTFVLLYLAMEQMAAVEQMTAQ
jgi:hypothetical protein